MQSKKRLAMYIRLSMEDDDIRSSDSKTESNSIGNQRKLLQDYYESHNELQKYEITEFCDDGYSGTNFKRPRFMDMMELVRQREIHCIMVKDLSRFGREYLEVGAYLELILPLFGTRFISVNDNFDSADYIGTTGGLELALKNLINGLYSKDLSIKVRSAIKTRNRHGRYWGGGAFYGYLPSPNDKHKLIVDEEVRPVVCRIFDRCIDGLSTAQIAQELNEDEIPSPMTRKQQLGHNYNGRVVEGKAIWMASTIRRILKDERYTGKMISGTRETIGISTGKMRSIPKEEWIVVDGTHEAIISQAQYQEAGLALQRRLKTINTNTNGYREDNLFVCGYCGRKLQKSHGKITHLFCLKARGMPDSACAELHEDMELLKENTLRVVRTLAKLLLEKHIREEASVNQAVPKLEKEIASAQRQLQSLQSSKLDLYEDYRLGKFSKEQFVTIQAERQKRADQLQDTIEIKKKKLEQLQKDMANIQKTVKSAKDIWALSEYRPEVIRKLVKRVRVYAGGRIEIDLNCGDAFAAEVLEKVQDAAS